MLNQFNQSWLNVSLMIFTIVFSVSCTKTKRTFDNPNDPNAVIIDTTENSPVLPQDNAASPESETTQTSTTSCLSGSCNPPAGSVYDFANVFSITPAGCTISKARMFDTGLDLMFFILAHCGQRKTVYSLMSDYDGSNLTPPTNVSTDCNFGSTGVTDFDVAYGSTSYQVVYNCYTSSPSYTTRVVTISADGSPSQSVLYETSSASFQYKIAWSTAANSFGIARIGKFQRFNESASSVGGPITINGNASISHMTVLNGSWYIFHNYNNYLSFCSKISSLGNLQCDSASTSANVITSSSQGKLLNAYDLKFNFYTINESNCTASTDFNPLATKNTMDVSLESMEISSTISGHLFKSSAKSLIFATFDSSGSGIHSENSITGYSNTMNSAEAKIINDKIYVAFDKDNSGYVSYSTQSAP